MLGSKKFKNGINVSQLNDKIKSLQKKPELAKFEFRAKNNWITGGHSVSSIKNFSANGKEVSTREESFTIESDQHLMLMGEDMAPNSAEIVLHALVSSLTTTLTYHAAKAGITIQSMESTINGCVDFQGFLGLDAEVRKGYNYLDIVFKVKSDATEEQLQNLSKFSPVLDVIINPTPVNIIFETETINK